jgi:pimeloyl-ACP methyl ester carboxylesterase
VRAVLGFLLVPLAMYAGLCLLTYLTQRSQMYFPVRETSADGAQDLRVAVAGAELKVWAVERPGEAALLYFGGNAEDVSANIAPFSEAFPDRSLYLVNYRGYGGSTGSPTEAALVADAIALYDRLPPRQADLCVVGRSLGSGVAMQLAAARPVRCLVLVTPFDSMVSVARHHFGWLPVRLLLRDRYESARRAGAVEARTLVVVAGRDEIVPRASSDALVGALAPERTRVMVIDGAGHNEIDFSPRYLAELARFMESAR